MPEPGARTPASSYTASLNAMEIARDPEVRGAFALPLSRSARITNELRDELESRGLRGFRRGGRVKRTGVYKLHAGERVIPRGRRRGRR